MESLFLILSAPAIFFTIFWSLINIKKRLRRGKTLKWAFFHPFCNDGGGGQKVLWCIVKALAETTTDQIVIYSLEGSKTAIMEKVKSRFGVEIEGGRFEIIYVEGRSLLTSKGFLTMVMHIVLPVIYVFKCLWRYQPDIFYDTTGYASTLVAFKILLPFSTSAAYVHYPFISGEMLDKVRHQRADFNNSQIISRSPLLSKLKLAYYYVIYFLYKGIGYFVDFAQTNSTWTHSHMTQIWQRLHKKGKLTKLYPPCTVHQLLQLAKPDPENQIQIMSLAQFRPEKQQLLQLEVLSELVKQKLGRKIKLKMCGTTRGAEDQLILGTLRSRAKELAIDEHVEFVVNQPFSTIQSCLQQSWIGLHTMEAEHFGISVVEMLAAGLLVVAHNSAGPRFDIIKEQRYLANSSAEYAQRLKGIVRCSKEELLRLSGESRAKSHSFGEESFRSRFLESLLHLKSS